MCGFATDNVHRAPREYSLYLPRAEPRKSCALACYASVAREVACALALVEPRGFEPLTLRRAEAACRSSRVRSDPLLSFKCGAASRSISASGGTFPLCIGPQDWSLEVWLAANCSRQ